MSVRENRYLQLIHFIPCFQPTTLILLTKILTVKELKVKKMHPEHSRQITAYLSCDLKSPREIMVSARLQAYCQKRANPQVVSMGQNNPVNLRY